MSIEFGLITAIEITVIMLIVWGFYNEDKLIKFEDKLAWLIASYITKVKRKRYMKKHKKVISKRADHYISATEMEKVIYDASLDNVA